MENKMCEECGKIEVPPYRKKYCNDCANKKKAEYEANQLPITESEKVVDAPKINNRSASIVAQVILKGAVQLTESRKFGRNDELGEYLSMCVNELTGAYKLALSNVKAL